MQIPSSYLGSSAEPDWDDRRDQQESDIENLIKYMREQHGKYLKPIYDNDRHFVLRDQLRSQLGSLIDKLKEDDFQI